MSCDRRCGFWRQAGRVVLCFAHRFCVRVRVEFDWRVNAGEFGFLGQVGSRKIVALSLEKCGLNDVETV